MTRQESISDILARNLKRSGLAKAASAARVCAAADGVSKSDFEGLFQAVSFRTGTLKIRVKFPPAAYLLKLQKNEIVDKINSKLGRKLLVRIIFVISEGKYAQGG